MSIGRYLRKSYEITGWADTENGVVYCENCLLDGDKEKLTPIFLGDEADFPGHACDNCHEHIEAQLINYDED